MNNTNPIQKKWLVLIAALIMLAFSLKDFYFSMAQMVDANAFVLNGRVLNLA